jgi:hypothetical protein
MLTIPMSISSRLQVIWNNNNRNYESESATRFALALCSEDEFGKPICFRLLLTVALLSSMDSDLEAFSHNPTDGSFTALSWSGNRIYQLSEPTVPLVLS